MALSNLHTNYKVSYKDDLINLTKERENGALKNGNLDELNAQIDETGEKGTGYFK